MSTNALVPFNEVREMAKAAASSGLFPGIRTPEQAFTLMLLCQAEGLHPIMAMRRYHILDGKPSLRADAMLADFQKAGGRVKWLTRTHEVVTATFSSPHLEEPVTITWTIQDAQKANLAGKTNYRNYARHMLTARVISEGVGLAMAAVKGGLYTPEEVSDFDDVREKYTPPMADPVALAAKETRIAVIEPEREPGSDDGDEEPAVPEDAPELAVADAELAHAGDGPVPLFRCEKEGHAKDHSLKAEWVPAGETERLSREQLAKIHILRRERGIADDKFRERLVAKFGKSTSAELSREEASTIIEALEAAKARHGTVEQKRARQEERVRRGAADVAAAFGADEVPA